MAGKERALGWRSGFEPLSGAADLSLWAAQRICLWVAQRFSAAN